jgi:hypothetical protein
MGREVSHTLQVVEDVMDHVAEDKVVEGEVPETTNQRATPGAQDSGNEVFTTWNRKRETKLSRTGYGQHIIDCHKKCC